MSFSIPQDQEFALIKNDLSGIMAALQSTDTCTEYYGRVGHLLFNRTTSWNGHDNDVKVYVRSGVYCVEWNLASKGPEGTALWFNTMWNLWDDQNSDNNCSEGTIGSTADANSRAIAVCDEMAPIVGNPVISFSAVSWLDNTYDGTKGGMACAGGVAIGAAAGAARGGGWVGAAIGAAASSPICIEVLLGEMDELLNGNYVVGDLRIRTGILTISLPDSYVSIGITDHLEDKRSDTFDSVEYAAGFLAPDDYKGWQHIHWQVVNSANGRFTFDPSQTRIEEWEYDKTGSFVGLNKEGKLHGTVNSDLESWGDHIQTRAVEYNDGPDPDYDGLDWEVDDPLCTLARELRAVVNGVTYSILLAGPSTSIVPGCRDDLNFAEIEVPVPGSPLDAWFIFEVVDFTLEASEVNLGTLSISEADVEADGSNLTRAMARKATSNETFVLNVEEVVIPTGANSQSSEECNDAETEFGVTSEGIAEGLSTVQGTELVNSAYFPHPICFQHVPFSASP